MIEYLIEESPDQRVIDRACQALIRGEMIVIPTPTGWCFAVHPGQKKGVEKLYSIKRAQKKKHFSLLCRDLAQLSRFAVIPNHFFKIIKRNLPGPYTLILNPTTSIPTPIKQYWKQKEVGVRMIESRLIGAILEAIEGPLLVGSVTAQLFQKNQVTEGDYLLSYQIEDEFDHCLAVILDDSSEVGNTPTSVVDLTDEQALLIREGLGDVSIFGL